MTPTITKVLLRQQYVWHRLERSTETGGWCPFLIRMRTCKVSPVQSNAGNHRTLRKRTHTSRQPSPRCPQFRGQTGGTYGQAELFILEVAYCLKLSCDDAFTGPTTTGYLTIPPDLYLTTHTGATTKICNSFSPCRKKILVLTRIWIAQGDEERQRKEGRIGGQEAQLQPKLNYDDHLKEKRRWRKKRALDSSDVCVTASAGCCLRVTWPSRFRIVQKTETLPSGRQLRFSRNLLPQRRTARVPGESTRSPGGSARHKAERIMQNKPKLLPAGLNLFYCETYCDSLLRYDQELCLFQFTNAKKFLRLNNINSEQ
ncbi:hypothetical protein JOB18_007375 [Solea senegalensis]|uniref:Uncharacterized protein n=1 Tax=Solea senegalensis TaxID=28829 RepID=A0AAV6Q475_SOLSE|nr:hypothetical protein JOB18_007375 [Solea senegalensis]